MSIRSIYSEIYMTHISYINTEKKKITRLGSPQRGYMNHRSDINREEKESTRLGSSLRGYVTAISGRRRVHDWVRCSAVT